MEVSVVPHSDARRAFEYLQWFLTRKQGTQEVPQVLLRVRQAHDGEFIVLLAFDRIGESKHPSEDFGLSGEQASVDAESDAASNKNDIAVLYPELVVVLKGFGFCHLIWGLGSQ